MQGTSDVTGEEIGKGQFCFNEEVEALLVKAGGMMKVKATTRELSTVAADSGEVQRRRCEEGQPWICILSHGRGRR